MGKKTPTLFKESEKYAENTQRWNGIFERYDIKQASPTAEEKTLPTSGDDIDVEYE